MPFALTLIGLLLVITGFQNTHKELGSQIASDFTGNNNFIYWIAALGVVGALGYVKALEPFSRAFLVLILLSIFLSNKGFFSQFNNALTKASNSNPSGTPILNNL